MNPAGPEPLPGSRTDSSPGSRPDSSPGSRPDSSPGSRPGSRPHPPAGPPSGQPPKAPALRLFVAVAVPEQVRDAVAEAAAALRRRAPRLRWVEPERWHLTAAFLGWTDPARLGAVKETLAEVAERSAPFPLELDATAGSFRGGVLWVGVAVSEPFATLAGQVQSSLVPLGFEFERRAFHPHLTLARAPRGQRVPADLASGYAGPAARWQVDRLELQRSRLARAGAAYELIASWRLGPVRDRRTHVR